MKYFLDTNIISYALKGMYPHIEKKLSEIPAYMVMVPSMVTAELEYGAKKSSNYYKTIYAYDSFTRRFKVANFGRKAAVFYGEIRSGLERFGTPISHNDMVIAATVLAEGGVLVTHNVKEFSRIPKLKIEDWTIDNQIPNN